MWYETEEFKNLTPEQKAEIRAYQAQRSDEKTLTTRLIEALRKATKK